MSEHKLPKVVIYDIFALHCELLRQSLENLGVAQSVVCAHDIEALTEFIKSDPDWVLIASDLGTDGLGLEVCRRIHQMFRLLPILVCVRMGDTERMVQAFRAGAAGVLFGNEDLAEVQKAIDCVYRGEVWGRRTDLRLVLGALAKSDHSVTDVAGKRLLTPREEEVASLVIQGFSNKEIAHSLDLTESTIKNYVFHIFDKLGISNRVELVRYMNRTAGTAD